MMNDLIADALTRIRNASMRKLEVTTLIHSNTVEALCKVLKEKEYIEDCKVVETDLHLNMMKTKTVLLTKLKEFLNQEEEFIKLLLN